MEESPLLYTAPANRMAHIFTSATPFSPSILHTQISRLSEGEIITMTLSTPQGSQANKPINYSWNTKSRQFSPRSTNNHCPGFCKASPTQRSVSSGLVFVEGSHFLTLRHIVRVPVYPRSVSYTMHQPGVPSSWEQSVYCRGKKIGDVTAKSGLR